MPRAALAQRRLDRGGVRPVTVTPADLHVLHRHERGVRSHSQPPASSRQRDQDASSAMRSGRRRQNAMPARARPRGLAAGALRRARGVPAFREATERDVGGPSRGATP